KAISKGTRGIGLSGAGGHLDERTRLIASKGLFEVRDGFDLASAHAGRGERMREGHFCEPGAKGVRFGGPRGECFRAMKREDAARARLGVAIIAKESFDPGGFVEERKRS